MLRKFIGVALLRFVLFLSICQIQGHQSAQREKSIPPPTVGNRFIYPFKAESLRGITALMNNGLSLRSSLSMIVQLRQQRNISGGALCIMIDWWNESKHACLHCDQYHGRHVSVKSILSFYVALLMYSSNKHMISILCSWSTTVIQTKGPFLLSLNSPSPISS